MAKFQKNFLKVKVEVGGIVSRAGESRHQKNKKATQ